MKTKLALFFSIIFCAFSNFTFFSNTAAAQQRVPVLVIPGFLGTQPQFTYLLRFLFERGVQPEAFDVIPEYRLILDKFTARGYALDKDLYFAGFDWRLSPAKTDNSIDGIISSGAGEITDDVFATGLDYFGYYLLQCAINNPGVREVDIVCHSTGGIIARSYIQSLAYNGRVYSEGKAYRLPKIRKLIMLSVPSRGASFAWNPWQGNLINVQGFERAGSVLALVYKAVRDGYSKINGHDYIIDAQSLRDPRNGDDPATRFTRLYMPSIKDLLSTYDFLLDEKNRLVDLNGSRYENKLLNDLNYHSAENKNSWIDKVSKVDVTFGISETTNTYVLTKTGPGGRVVAINDISLPRDTKPGEVWYLDSAVAEYGDKVVPLNSLISDYTNNERISIIGWSNNNVNTEIIYNVSPGAVDHVSILNNGEVMDWIVNRITTE